MCVLRSYSSTIGFFISTNRLIFTMVLSQMDAGRALTSAAAKGNTDDVRRILEECRVHPDTLNEFGRTALQVHVSSGCWVSMQYRSY